MFFLTITEGVAQAEHRKTTNSAVTLISRVNIKIYINGKIVKPVRTIFLQEYFEMRPVITIEYCPKCKWMLRAAYFAQELLTTFTDDVHGVMLHPSDVDGTFRILVDQAEVFDRKRTGRFPETKELKQLVRDIVNPGKDLGHSDRR